MIILGIILAVIGYVTGVSILYSIGALLVVVGVILWILGAGRASGWRPQSLVLARLPLAQHPGSANITAAHTNG